MKRQYYVARSDFAFRKYRERIALLQRSDDLRVDVRGVAALRALDEQRAALRAQPADHRPAPDFGLGDKTHGVH